MMTSWISYCLEPPRFRAELVDRQRRSVVDEQRSRGQRLDRRFEVLPLVGRQLAVAHVARVESRLADDQTHHQLLGAHFEREEGNPFFEIDRHVARQRQHESRLTHRRARRNDNQVGRLPAERQPVEVSEPGRHAAESAFALRRLLDYLKRFGNDVARLLHVALDVSFRHLEYLAFGQVDQVRDVHRLVVGFFLYFGRRADQFALDVLLRDDFAMELDVSGRADLLGQLRQVGRASDRGQLAGLPELLADGVQVDRLELHRQVHDRLVDRLVRFLVERLGRQDALNLDDRVLLEHQRAEYRFFQLDRLRGNQRALIGQHGGCRGVVFVRVVPFGHFRILCGERVKIAILALAARAGP